jgi:hypothetical protein
LKEVLVAQDKHIYDAIAKGDANTFSNLLTGDFIFVDGNGVMTKADLVKQFTEKNAGRLESITCEDEQWNGDHLIQFITQSDTAIPQVARQFRNLAAQGRPGDMRASLLNPARTRIKAGFSVGLMDVRRRETKGHVRSVPFQTVEPGIVKFDGAIRHAHIVPQVNWRNQAFSQLCAFCSPKSGSVSAIGILPTDSDGLLTENFVDDGINLFSPPCPL